MNIPDEAKKLLETRVVAIGTIGDYPNVTPVLYCKVVDNQIIITHNYMEETLDNIAENKKTCLAVWDDTPNNEYGYKFYGTAEYFPKGKWLAFVKGLKENKGFPAKGAIVFTPERIKKI